MLILEKIYRIDEDKDNTNTPWGALLYHHNKHQFIWNNFSFEDEKVNEDDELFFLANQKNERERERSVHPSAWLTDQLHSRSIQTKQIIELNQQRLVQHSSLIKSNEIYSQRPSVSMFALEMTDKLWLFSSLLIFYYD